LESNFLGIKIFFDRGYGVEENGMILPLSRIYGVLGGVSPCFRKPCRALVSMAAILGLQQRLFSKFRITTNEVNVYLRNCTTHQKWE
jgi:hypothetical protein